MPNRLRIWAGVPNASKLNVKVTGSDENFNVTGTLLSDPGGVQTIPHSSLVAGAEVDLSSSSDYVLTLDYSFLGEEETEVSDVGTVTKPDGTPYGAPRPAFESAGKNPETDLSKYVLVTRKS